MNTNLTQEAEPEPTPPSPNSTEIQRSRDELKNVLIEVLTGRLYDVIKRTGRTPSRGRTSRPFGTRQLLVVHGEIPNLLLQESLDPIDRNLYTILVTGGALSGKTLVEMCLQSLDQLIDKVTTVTDQCIYGVWRRIFHYCIKCVNLAPGLAEQVYLALHQATQVWTDKMGAMLKEEVRKCIHNPFSFEEVTLGELCEATGETSSLPVTNALLESYFPERADFDILRSLWICEIVRRRVTPILAAYVQKSFENPLRFPTSVLAGMV